MIGLLMMCRVRGVPQIPFNGHAIESRVYAEDPIRGFLPSIGPLTTYKEPELHDDAAGRPLVRIDTGVFDFREDPNELVPAQRSHFSLSFIPHL